MANMFTKLFFVDDSGNEKKQEPIEVKNDSVNKEFTVNVKSSNENNPEIVGSVNPKILSVLSETLEKSNIEGPDYQELKLGADKMEKAGISDENARYIAAYIGLKAGYPNLSKDKILQSIDYYIEVVNKEKESGLQELLQVKKTTVDDKQIEVKKMEEKISSLNEEINKLKNKILDETSKITKYRNEIISSKRECEQNEANFNATINFVLKSLKNDKEKLSLILND